MPKRASGSKFADAGAPDAFPAYEMEFGGAGGCIGACAPI